MFYLYNSKDICKVTDGIFKAIKVSFKANSRFQGGQGD